MGGGGGGTDTLLNGLTTRYFKEHCDIQDVSLSLAGAGKFELQFEIFYHNKISILSKQIISLQDKLQEFIIPNWQQLPNGILYFRLLPVTSGYIKSGFYSTTTKPRRSVKLALVICHYNRKNILLPTVKRFQNFIKQNPNVEIIIVDNSQNISQTEAAGATVIPNSNYGGSGGFMRGLLYAKDSRFTHCLFADDDAVYEPESVYRTKAFLDFSKDDKLTVHGAVLLVNTLSILLDKFVTIDTMTMNVCDRVRAHYKDMHYINTKKQLLEIERPLKKPSRHQITSSSWCYFAFPIKYINNFGPPLSKYWDDVLFSIMNNLPVIAPNSAVAYHDNRQEFDELKFYLNTRNMLILLLSIGHVTFLNYVKLLRDVATFIFDHILLYHYDKIAIMRLAIEDILKGKISLLENLNVQKLNKKLQTINHSTLLNIDDFTGTKQVTNHIKNESKLKNIIRKVTLNSILLPSFLLKKQIVVLQENTDKHLRQIFRFKKVLHITKGNKKILTEQNKLLIFKESIVFLWLLIKLFVNFRQLKKTWGRDILEITTEKFWRDVYQIEGK